MPTPRELLKARRNAERAALTADLIAALPRRVGAFYEWDNGVKWERVGDDSWRPWHTDPDTGEFGPGDDEVYGLFSSAHVATHADRALPQRLH